MKIFVMMSSISILACLMLIMGSDVIERSRYGLALGSGLVLISQLYLLYLYFMRRKTYLSTGVMLDGNGHQLTQSQIQNIRNTIPFLFVCSIVLLISVAILTTY